MHNIAHYELSPRKISSQIVWFFSWSTWEGEGEMHAPDERQNIRNFCEAWGEFLQLVEWGTLLLAIFKWFQMNTARLTVVFAEHLTRKYKRWPSSVANIKCSQAYHHVCYFSDNHSGDLRRSASVQLLRASFCNCGHVLYFPGPANLPVWPFLFLLLEDGCDTRREVAAPRLLKIKVDQDISRALLSQVEKNHPNWQATLEKT